MHTSESYPFYWTRSMQNWTLPRRFKSIVRLPAREMQNLIWKIACSITSAKMKLKDGSLIYTPYWSPNVVTIHCDELETLTLANLRNCITNPRPEVLEKLREELLLCIKYTEKSINRQGA